MKYQKNGRLTPIIESAPRRRCYAQQRSFSFSDRSLRVGFPIFACHVAASDCRPVMPTGLSGFSHFITPFIQLSTMPNIRSTDTIYRGRVQKSPQHKACRKKRRQHYRPQTPPPCLVTPNPLPRKARWPNEHHPRNTQDRPQPNQPRNHIRKALRQYRARSRSSSK